MNVTVKSDVLLEPVQLYLQFHEKVYLMFSLKQMIIHGQTDNENCYTKIMIEENNLDLFVNSFYEKKTFEGEFTAGYQYNGI